MDVIFNSLLLIEDDGKFNKEEKEIFEEVPFM
jgi:hypothetical protein